MPAREPRERRLVPPDGHRRSGSEAVASRQGPLEPAYLGLECASPLRRMAIQGRGSRRMISRVTAPATRTPVAATVAAARTALATASPDCCGAGRPAAARRIGPCRGVRARTRGSALGGSPGAGRRATWLRRRGTARLRGRALAPAGLAPAPSRRPPSRAASRLAPASPRPCRRPRPSPPPCSPSWTAYHPSPASRCAFPAASGAGFRALLRHPPWPGILVLRGSGYMEVVTATDRVVGGINWLTG